MSNFAGKCGLTQKRIGELELATEEAVVNVIRYAYPKGSGTVEARCGVDENDRIIIEIVDTGTPFNPLSQSKPKLTDDVDERKIGGLGIFFIRMMMDHVKYRHENGKNILTLIPHQE